MPSAPCPSVIASGHPEVTAAAGAILQAGGNAFDAAVAAGFACAVAEPTLTSLGGGGFLLARTAAGQACLFDFFANTPGRGLPPAALTPQLTPVTIQFPGSSQLFNVGLGTIAVPGNLAGYLHVHRRLGRLPLAQVLAPAVRLARDGLPLNAGQAYFIKLLTPIMTLTDPGRQLYAPAGHCLQAGDRFVNPDLAAFLENLPGTGATDFYQGALARRMEQNIQAGGGLLNAADLAAYRVIERTPLQSTYRGLQLLTNPAPALGGTLLALTLRLLESAALAAESFGSPAHLRYLLAAMQETHRWRTQSNHDPARLAAVDLAASQARVASGGTTHISVCDSAGNAASMTTSNGEGSGFIVPGTGIMLNNMMGEDDLRPDCTRASPPGQRLASMMTPSLLLAGDRLRLILGSGGSKRITAAMAQVISAVVDFNLDVAAAVAAPRLHWDGACAQVEPGFTAAGVAALRQRWPVNDWRVRDVYFGGVHAVAPQGEGGGDPRRGGQVLIL